MLPVPTGVVLESWFLLLHRMPVGLFLCHYFQLPCRMHPGLLFSSRGNSLLFLLEWSNVRYRRVVVLHGVLAWAVRLGLGMSQLRSRHFFERRYGDIVHIM